MRSSAFRDASRWLRDESERCNALHAELASIPSPPFGEELRAQWLLDHFSDLSFPHCEIDQQGNVVARRPGSARKSAGQILLTAHLDTVFPAGTRFEVKRAGTRLCAPGISDNTAGVIALLITARLLAQFSFTHRLDIILAGTVGEEGEGNLRGMRHLFRTAEWRSRTRGVLVIDGAGTDAIVS